MRKTVSLILSLLLGIAVSTAQKKLPGRYYSKENIFVSSDTGVLIQPFDHNRLAPFMIKGKDPFDQRNNKVGFIDTIGNVIIKPKYVNASEFKNGYAIVAEPRGYRLKLGLINTKGTIVIPVNFSALSECDNGLFLIRKDTSISFVDTKGRVVVPFGKYSAFASPHPEFLESTDDVGHQDFLWDLLPFYNYVHFAKYIGVKTGKKWAVIDKSGREVLPPIFDGIEIFDRDIVPVKVGVKFGVADIKGHLIIPALYDEIVLTSKNFLYVDSGPKMGVLSFANKLIIPIKFMRINAFGDGFTAVDSAENATLFDANGRQISKPISNPIINFPFWGRENFFVYNSTDKKYHSYQKIKGINYRGIVSKPLFYYNNGWGVMDTVGRELTPPIFDEIDDDKLQYLDYPNHDLIAVSKAGKWGIINDKGRFILKAEYDEMIQDRGILFVEKTGKCGIFNNFLKQLTELKYDSLVITYPAESQNHNINSTLFIRARIGNKWGLLDNTGKEVVPVKYNQLPWIYYNMALVQNAGKYGVVNFKGKQIIDCFYDDISFCKDIFIIEKGDKFGTMNFEGKIIDPFNYSKIECLYGAKMLHN